MSGRLRPFQPVPYGRFTLVAPLAVGGMGEVYLAKAHFPGGLTKLCVIKKVLPHLAEDPEFVARFLDEAKILIKLQHGSIAQVFETGVHGHESFIALEFVDGKDLRKVMLRAGEQGHPLPVELSLHVASRILEALAYAHRKRDEKGVELGLVHRDVSPQNVLLSYDGEVKVIDFGLAKSQQSVQRTRPSVILGKFHYMAPEQARNERVDRRADLYALGVILWELVSGKNPFEDVPPYELLERVARPRIPPIDRVVPDVPGPLAAVLERALQAEPTLRFQSAEEMRGRLSEVLFAIRPDMGPERLASWLRTHFHTEYEAERKVIAQVSGPLPEQVLAPSAESPARTQALIDTAGGDDPDTERFDRRRRPQHAADTGRFDPDETPGPEPRRGPAPAWFEPPGSQPRPRLRPDLELTASRDRTQPSDVPWSQPEERPAPTPVSDAVATTPPAPGHRADPTEAITAESVPMSAPVAAAATAAEGAYSAGPIRRRPTGPIAIAAVVLLLGAAYLAFREKPVNATRPSLPPIPPVAAAEPEPTPAIPTPTAPAPVARPAAPLPAAAAPALRRERPAPGEAAPESPRRSALLRRHDAIELTYVDLLRRHGTEKVGAIVVNSKRAVDSSFDRLIESPDRYDELERQLADLERILEERRRNFGPP